MKIGITVNLGDYENIKLESSEHDNWMDAATELFEALWLIKEEPGVRRFLEKPMWKPVKEQYILSDSPQGGEGNDRTNSREEE